MSLNLTSILNSSKNMSQRTHLYITILVVVLAAIITGCSKNNSWTVEGRIDGANGKVMVVEGCHNGQWYPIDSVKLDATGGFRVSHEAQGYPDIYRLRLGDKILYFPIDSIETVTVMAKADAFDSEYTLSGSPSAEQLMEIDRKVRTVMNEKGVEGASQDSMLKRYLGGMLIGNPSGIVSYYIVNKRIGQKPLFDPSNSRDLKVIGAVATAFEQFRPNDPRTHYLHNLYIDHRSAMPEARKDTLVATQTGMINISLPDVAGTQQSLSEVSRDSKIVLLSFIDYSDSESQTLNRDLRRIYEKYHHSGLQIYQVSVDRDPFLWKRVSESLPWVCVYSDPTVSIRSLVDYNVQDLPELFIISHGDIKERVTDLSTLEHKIAAQIGN